MVFLHAKVVILGVQLSFIVLAVVDILLSLVTAVIVQLTFRFGYVASISLQIIAAAQYGISIGCIDNMFWTNPTFNNQFR